MSDNKPRSDGIDRRLIQTATDRNGEMTREQFLDDCARAWDIALAQPMALALVPIAVRGAPSVSLTDAFETFWSTYPRRVGKRNAEAAFARACKRATFVDIVSGAAAYRDDPNRVAEFTAHPTTWLNRDGWDDDPLPEKPGRRRGPSVQQEVARFTRMAEGR